MKKIFAALIMAICTTALCTISAYAYSDGEFAELDIRVSDGFYTVITDTQGECHTLGGIIDTEKLEKNFAIYKIASYAIYCGDEQLINVKLNEISPQADVYLFEEGTPIVSGYYSVRFTLSKEDNTKVFLTGLTDSNVETVQKLLVCAKLENSEFTMEDLDFIDAEKTSLPNDGDNELCWAASAANILHYTGWATQADLGSEDDLLDLFRDSFDDASGNPFFGFEWFFNATNQSQAWENWAHVKDYGSTGGYLKDYASTSVIDIISVDSNHEKIIPIIQSLENGSGLAMTLGWVDDKGHRNGGHSVSLWGYIYDLDEDELSAEHYKAFIISDSDSDQQSDSDRRKAPNKLMVLNASPYNKFSYDSWEFDGYGGVFDQVTILKPYRNDVEYETDTDATKDKFLSPDFIIDSVYSANDPLDDFSKDRIFFENDTIYIRPEIQNAAECSYKGELSFDVTIYDKTTDRKIVSKPANINVNFDSYGGGKLSAVSFKELGAGEYTAEITLNPDKAVTEAYFYNNYYSFDFTVTDEICDTSNAKVYADFDEINGFSSPATIRYEGIDQLEIAKHPTAEYAILASYYVDENWQNIEFACDSDGNELESLTKLPDRFIVEAKGSKMKFKLCIYSAEGSFPTVNIYSDEYTLNYSWLTINEDETNTGSYTALECGAKSLAEGEKFAFTVTNSSTFDSGELSIDAVVYARKGNDEIELFRQDGILLEYGETTETISFNSWEPSLSGKYEIVAAIDNGYGFDECVLGELAISEQYSFKVTTGNDVTDEYDGDISLREAVMYFEQYGGQNDCISFDDGISVLYMYSPITIEENIEISGSGNVIYGLSSTQLFIVTNSGSLNADGLIFHSGYSQFYGGAIENRGGTVNLNGSRLIYSNSGASGGAIYSDGGSVTLKNCSIKGNSSPQGAAVSAVNGAVLNMLNCIVFQNESDGEAVYNNGSTANIVYSTFSSNGGSAVCGEGGNTNMIGSIAVFNGEEDISGAVNVYGCYYTASSQDAVVDKTSIQGQGNHIFRLSEDGAVIWEGYYTIDTFAYKTGLSSIVNEGIFVKNIDGKIAYSYGQDVFDVTDVPSAFTDEEYSKDLFGNTHGPLFGAISQVCEDIEIINVTEDNVAEIYLPSAKDVLFIERICNADGSIKSVNLYNMTLEAGTSYIRFSKDIVSGDKKYMLWESLDSMKPLCEAYE